MADRPLTSKQLRFVELYQQSIASGKPNGTQAYMDAFPGCSRASAAASAPRLLGDVRVQRLLAPVQQATEKATAKVVARIEINRDRIRNEFARLSFVNPKQLFREDGSLKAIHELDDDTAAAIASVEVEEVTKPGTETVTRTKKLKLWDKVRALKALGDTEPGVWAREDVPPGHTTNVNVAVLSDAELVRRIDALEGRTEPATLPERLLTVAANPPAKVQLELAAPPGDPPTPAVGDGREGESNGGDDPAPAREDPIG